MGEKEEEGEESEAVKDEKRECRHGVEELVLVSALFISLVGVRVQGAPRLGV